MAEKSRETLRTSRETLGLKTFESRDRDEIETFQNTSQDRLETETTSSLKTLAPTTKCENVKTHLFEQRKLNEITFLT